MFVATKQIVLISIVADSRLVLSTSFSFFSPVNTLTHTHQCYEQLSISSTENESHISINQDPELKIRTACCTSYKQINPKKSLLDQIL